MWTTMSREVIKSHMCTAELFSQVKFRADFLAITGVCRSSVQIDKMTRALPRTLLEFAGLYTRGHRWDINFQAIDHFWKICVKILRYHYSDLHFDQRPSSMNI